MAITFDADQLRSMKLPEETQQNLEKHLADQGIDGEVVPTKFVVIDKGDYLAEYQINHLPYLVPNSNPPTYIRPAGGLHLISYKTDAGEVVEYALQQLGPEDQVSGQWYAFPTTSWQHDVIQTISLVRMV